MDKVKHAPLNLIGHLELDDDQWEQTIRTGVVADVARAIAFHNNVGVKPVSFTTDPIAYLLVLCDEMQEWDCLFMLPDGDFTELKRIYIGPLDKT